jgi:CBS domain-containing protein
MQHRKVQDIMTIDVVTVTRDTPFKDVVRAIERDRIGGVPVLDGDGVLAGVISEADLLRKPGAHGRGTGAAFQRWIGLGRRAVPSGITAADLLTSPAVTVSATAQVAEAARLLNRHGIKRLPVVDDAGRLVGIVSASDLLRVFLRPDSDLAEEIEREVFARGLGVVVNPTTVRVEVRDGVATLRGEVAYRSVAVAGVAMARGVDGVVDVVDELTFSVDDVRHQRPRVDDQIAR